LFGDTNGNYLSPEYLETSPSEFDFLQKFLIDDNKLITNGFDVNTLYQLDPMTMFTKFIELGEWLRKNYTLNGFNYYLDVIGGCEKDYSWIGKAALCHGIFFDKNRDKIEKKYRLIEPFLAHN